MPFRASCSSLICVGVMFGSPGEMYTAGTVPSVK